MKKILLLSAALLIAFIPTSCTRDALDTQSTQQIDIQSALTTTDGAMMALNGTIRLMFQFGWSVGFNEHSALGPMGYGLMADVMGDDMIMANQGNGWFWYEHLYQVKRYYNSDGQAPYNCWRFYYMIIAQVNSILAYKDIMEGAKADVDYIIGNAYALRAYCYYYLELFFARSYQGHEDMLGVPVYTEMTFAGTAGNPRATNRQVFGRMMADIDSAIARLNGVDQRHVSHISTYVAQGLKARFALYMGDYQTAYDAAVAAAAGGTVMDDVTYGYNNAFTDEVLWGIEIIASQGTTNPQFMANMDTDFDSYGKMAPKCATQSLYNHMGGRDARRAWWTWQADMYGREGYIQKKFQFANKQVEADGTVTVTDTYTGADQIWMRVPEMILIQAECLARLGRESEAQTVLNDFMSHRDPEFDCSSLTGLDLATLTSETTGSLLEEIIWQRRIELWGEYGRIFDIKRLRQGFTRTTAEGFLESALLLSLDTSNPESFDWVYTIPQDEINYNPWIVQNPVESAPSGDMGDDPSLTPDGAPEYNEIGEIISAE